MRELRKHRLFRVAAAALAALTGATSIPVVWAASHREAPLIALDPAADNTDTYAFRSWEDPSKVVYIANVIPGQEPGDGPNYFSFDDNVLYRIHIDNNQDGVAEDIVYEFRFTTETRPVLGSLNFPLPYVGNPNIPIPQLQGIIKLDGPGSEGLTRRQTYTVTEVRGKKRTRLFKGKTLVAVPSNVGPATMPNYEGLAAQGIYSDGASGIRVFAGQRAETFYIDLGAVFDTVNLRRFPPVLTPGEDANDAADPFGVNRFSGFNVNSIAIEVPITRITRDGRPPTSDSNSIIGMYASTSRQERTIQRGASEDVEKDDDDDDADNEVLRGRGKFVQVSRLANPLVNELIIDTPFKDRWNASEPEDEKQFQEFYKNPSLALALSLIFGIAVPAAGRTDLMSILLKYPGQALSGNNCGSPCAELLRLDLRVTPTPPESQKRLGGLAGDTAGFPNGRRPNDDVTDIATRVVAGVLSGDPCCTGFPHNRLGDGVNFLGGAPGAGTSDGLAYGSDAGAKLDVTPNGIAAEFPFLPTPHDGRNRRHVDCVQTGVGNVETGTGVPCVP
ncbi:MAG: DUF4331 domain-containing protein [candidate division NC10 bacterium]|nr:DUF4331 domain-containing protein [candidate division NC10 bacterium]